MSVRRRCARLAMGLLLGALWGCGGAGPDDEYGYARSTSVNGTGVFAELLRQRGHEVRSAVRLTDELADWAEVVVRFAPRPGAIEKDEAEWYANWLDDTPGGRLVYVPRDYDALGEYWNLARDQAPSEPPRLRERITEARDASLRDRPHPKEAEHTAPTAEWFAVKGGSGPRVCKTLAGPWARSVDAAAAAVSRNDVLKVEDDHVLLRGDDQPLAMEWTRDGDSKVLVVANGSFLLNVPITQPGRWPLVERTIRWVEDEAEAGTPPLRVAFVEGGFVTSEGDGMPSPFWLLGKAPFGLIIGQLAALGIAACLAWAPRLGRPRAEPASDAERPVAHPEALGALLERTGRASEARSLLESYHRWRRAPAAGGRSPRGPE